MAGYFITGTDTDAGKTLVTLGLMYALQQRGLRVNGFKAVAAGSQMINGQRCNSDAFLLMQQGSADAMQISNQQINPYLFDPPVAPHIAAAAINRNIDMNIIESAYDYIQQLSDVVLAEGAGGWLVPLNAEYSVGDIAVRIGLPVVIVVGLKLGCINHARLTLAAVRASGCTVAGWIGSMLDEQQPYVDDNIATLKQYLQVPCLGIVPFLADKSPAEVAAYLQIESLQ